MRELARLKTRKGNLGQKKKKKTIIIHEVCDDLILLSSGYVGNHALVQSQFPKTHHFPINQNYQKFNHSITQNPKAQTLNQTIKIPKPQKPTP